MAKVTFTGKDTVKINGRLFNDLADSPSSLTFPNELVSVKIGKNGNSIYAFNESGRQCDMLLKLIRGSDDDRYLNTQLVLMKADFTSFAMLTGEVSRRTTEKTSDDAVGITREDIYILSGGVFFKEVEIGATDDVAVANWRIRFTSAPRAITS